MIFSRSIQYKRFHDNFKVTFGKDSKEISNDHFNQNHEIPNLKTFPVDHNIHRINLENDYSDLEHISQGGTINPIFGTNSFITRPYDNDNLDQKMYSKTIQNYWENEFNRNTNPFSHTNAFTSHVNTINILDTINHLTKDERGIKDNIFEARANSEQRVIDYNVFGNQHSLNEKLAMSHQKFNNNQNRNQLFSKFMENESSSSDSDDQESENQEDQPPIIRIIEGNKNSENMTIDGIYQKSKYGGNNESTSYGININDSSGAHITGNFGGTFSNFKHHMDSKRHFNELRSSENIQKLINKFDIDVKDSITKEVLAGLSQNKSSKENSHTLIQTHVSIFDEEKLMKEEQLRIANRLTSTFRQYEKVCK